MTLRSLRDGDDDDDDAKLSAQVSITIAPLRTRSSLLKACAGGSTTNLDHRGLRPNGQSDPRAKYDDSHREAVTYNGSKHGNTCALALYGTIETVS